MNGNELPQHILNCASMDLIRTLEEAGFNPYDARGWGSTKKTDADGEPIRDMNE